MKPSQCTMKPYYTSNEFHQKKVEQENRKKKKKIQPSIRRVIESTLCRGAAEYRTVQGSLLNPRQDIHYSHKLPSQQNRRAGFTEREQPSLISCCKPYFPAWYGNPFPPSTPQPLFFHCSGRFLPSMAARKHAVSGHYTQETQEGEPFLHELPRGEGEDFIT